MMILAIWESLAERAPEKIGAALHIVDVVSEWTGKTASFLIILIIGTVLTEIILRKTIGSSLGLSGIAINGKVFTVYVVLGAAYTLLAQEHVNVDILHRRFPLRVRAFVDLITASLFFIFCFAILWMAFPKAGQNLQSLSFSFTLFSPASWPVRLFIPFGISIFLLQGLAKFIRDLITLTTGKEAL